MNERTWIVVPAFNEAPVLAETLNRLVPRAPNIVLVDDGSTDETPLVAGRFPVHLLRHEINLGQGAAIQTGIDYALSKGAEIVVTFDADGQMDESDIERLCSPLETGKADVALGTRFAPGSRSEIPRARAWVLRLAVAFTRATTGLRVSDAHNGLRAFSRGSLERLSIGNARMAHASELLHHISERGLRWVEVPVTIRYSPYSLRKGQRTADALNVLWELFFRP